MAAVTMDRGRLNLAYRDLREVPPAIASKFGSECQELDLSHNQVRSVSSLTGFTKLHTLILDDNLLTEHNCQFRFHPELSTLYINKNKINNLGVFVEDVKRAFPKLRVLSMINNPAAPSYFNGGSKAENTEYRLYVISQLPDLVMLDDLKVSEAERQAASKFRRAAHLF
ncbi:uncharacterized protein MONBRDRAFT_29997 [Monosiga brevicollis MX1]|uniref:U2A'/phosphoprotein 32 family A C-terminal domain-containing protein n=1 Tax=Monosiga brevicollis TaxID=81824 RepID=A9VCQ5_MONBE|nr:uncharacterized protein MONBRDRAFT_29997 [Monosiga brevicollis MX1]EDQ84689.1 predicted protein [Monosiga brevicollis MX1]|eukprot:XP_001750475.1 hypothetical protein [Monosiga brevicollis MX1]